MTHPRKTKTPGEAGHFHRARGSTMQVYTLKTKKTPGNPGLPEKVWAKVARLIRRDAGCRSRERWVRYDNAKRAIMAACAALGPDEYHASYCRAMASYMVGVGL